MRKKFFVPELPFDPQTPQRLEIDALTNLGLGVGRIEGWVVMVPFALPGEEVEVKLWRHHRNYSEADLLQVLRPSPHRIQAPCPLFTHCGGCQYQHLRYEEQLRWKSLQVREAFSRLGGIEVEVPLAWPSPREYGYRSKITPHYQRPREGRIEAIGFVRHGSRRLIDVPHCPLATPAINDALPQVREQARAQAATQRKGATLLLRDTGEEVVCDPKRRVESEIADQRFSFVAGDFFQNNPFILPALWAFVAEAASAPPVQELYDVYCGVGTFGISAASRFQRVIGIELSPAAVRLASENAQRNGAHNCSFLHGKAEEVFAQVASGSAESAVLIDPPRKGCERDFLDALFAFAPRRIVYVACDPATQARDVRFCLDAGYVLKAIQPFDLFPQTRHIENVVVLERGEGESV